MLILRPFSFFYSLLSIIFCKFKSLLSFINILFASKNLIFISKSGIKSFNLGFISQISFLIAFIAIINLIYDAFSYNKNMSGKIAQIIELSNINKQFNNKITHLSEKINNIDQYISTIYSSDNELFYQEEKNLLSNFKENKNLNVAKNIGNITKPIYQNDNDILLSNIIQNSYDSQIKLFSIKKNINNIESIAYNRFNDLKKYFSLSGIVISDNDELELSQNNSYPYNNVIEVSFNDLYSSARGGPLYADDSNIDNELSLDVNHQISSSASSDIMSKLTEMEYFINHMPITAPMVNYYISSRYGRRIDPINGKLARHNGVDFVGRNQYEPIVSPSIGRVKAIGTSKTYGNYIILDHGYGVTTLYAHLSKFNANTGDLVKKNQVIAFQGNTGRSTGSHLHYEIRYNNKTINPKNFLIAGRKINQNI